MQFYCRRFNEVFPLLNVKSIVRLGINPLPPQLSYVILERPLSGGFPTVALCSGAPSFAAAAYSYNYAKYPEMLKAMDLK